MLNMEDSTELFEDLVVKLPVIVSDKSMRESELINDWLSKGILDLVLGDVCQGFSFQLFDEVVDGD